MVGWTICCSAFPSALLGQDRARQLRLDAVCLASNVDRYEPGDAYWSARHPGRVAGELTELEGRGEWEESFKTITDRFRADRYLFTAQDVGVTLHQNFLDSLDAFADSINAGLEASRTAGVRGAPALTVRQTSIGNLWIGQPSRGIKVPNDTLAARSLCWAAHNATRFHERLTLPGRQEFERALRLRVQRWDTFNDLGLTPYPWELALNEGTNWLGSREELEPPSWQLILLRPEPAVTLDARLGNRANVIAVEVLGVLRYQDNRESYYGLSFVYSSPSEGKFGYGGMAHVFRGTSVGLLRQDYNNDGSREYGFVLTLDVFDLFASIPKTLTDARALAAARN